MLGHLLSMAAGGEDTLKGTFKYMHKAGGPCGEPTSWTREKGKFGFGAYKDEPYSLQAFQKRVYALRDFYDRPGHLDGTGRTNPGRDPIVVGTLSALSLLVGKTPQHVPQAMSRGQLAAIVGAADPQSITVVMAVLYVLRTTTNGNRAKQVMGEHVISRGGLDAWTHVSGQRQGGVEK